MGNGIVAQSTDIMASVSFPLAKRLLFSQIIVRQIAEGQRELLV
jgi:hypothetical protein